MDIKWATIDPKQGVPCSQCMQPATRVVLMTWKNMVTAVRAACELHVRLIGISKCKIDNDRRKDG